MNNIRNLKMDNYKGLLIYLVVLSHLLFSYDYYNNTILLNIVKFIYCFHMPLFLIISGYFSKKTSTKNIINILILFIILNFSYIIYEYVNYKVFDIFDIKYSSWYLLALAIYRLIIHLFNKQFDKYKRTILLISFIISVTIGYINITPVVNKIISYFFFFIFGYYLESDQLKRKQYNQKILITILFLLIYLVSFLPFHLNFYMASSYNHPIFMIFRLGIYVIDIIMFFSIYNIIPNKKITYLTTIGKKSLSIYIFHRIFTLIITNQFINSKYFIIISIITSILICYIFSLNIFKTIIDKILNIIYTIYHKSKILFGFVIIVLTASTICFYYKEEIQRYFYKPNIISYKQLDEIDNSVSIGFIGDLILLENQVNNYYNGLEYDFNDMFKYTTKYFNEVDYMIGVLEGPVDDGKEYSIGNYDDNKKLKLNYPSKFIESIKNNGIDLVTTANNHLLDNNLDSMFNTINNLNKINLDYVGSYKTKEDNYKNRRKIINIKNLKIGILSYTYGINNYTEDEIIENYSYYSNYLCHSTSRYYNKIKKQVEEDFRYLKNNKVDYIIVIPHYGTQFSSTEDSYQKLWNKIFIKNGANVILGSHSHHVQPIRYENNAVIINSVGNFVNSYTKHNGDISMMIKVYLSKEKTKITNVSVIPLLAVKNNDNAYYSVPIYEAINNKALSEVKKQYYDRIIYANKLVTKVSMNANVKEINKEYYFINNKYLKQNNYIFKLTDEDKQSFVYKKIAENNNICFIGDSITEGNKNNYHPWYEELMNLFNGKNIYNYSKGGYTTEEILNNFDLKDNNCDLVFINIGTNDIRYYERNAKDYVNNINKILNNFNNRQIILLSPFRTTNKDRFLTNKDKKIKLYNEYDKCLEDMADNKNIYYIDQNKYINKALTDLKEDTFLLDGVHPNNNLGIKLYSYAVLRQ